MSDRTNFLSTDNILDKGVSPLGDRMPRVVRTYVTWAMLRVGIHAFLRLVSYRECP